jgi:uncharacterized protein (DUF1697 family)
MRYAAFLRAVNVAGNQLSMSALRSLFETLDFDSPQTLLQSGNIVFAARKAAKPSDLETLLERETMQRLHVQTQYFVRTAQDLDRIIEGNPFPREARNDPGRLVVVFLKNAAAAKNVSALEKRITGPEVVKAAGCHLYITYPDGQGRSKLTNSVIEKALDMRGTARNWNTILKMAAALQRSA